MDQADLPVVGVLSAELGYPVEAKGLSERFAVVSRSADDALLVADEAGEVIGWVHVQSRTLLESEPSAELVALVVSSTSRRGGVGKTLVDACIGWARSRGLPRVRVRSNVTRIESHRFYPAIGFTLVKTSHLYELLLE